MNINTDTNAMSMVRGDYEYFSVGCEFDNGVVIPMVNGDTLYLTVKEDARATDEILQIPVTTFTNGIATVEIQSTDTELIEPKEYVYDIRLIKADGKKYTIIKKAAFILEEDVTDE